MNNKQTCKSCKNKKTCNGKISNGSPACKKKLGLKEFTIIDAITKNAKNKKGSLRFFDWRKVLVNEKRKDKNETKDHRN